MCPATPPEEPTIILAMAANGEARYVETAATNAGLVCRDGNTYRTALPLVIIIVKTSAAAQPLGSNHQR